MPSPCCPFAAIFLVVLSGCLIPVAATPPQPIAILTQASCARLAESEASPGLSVFEGERLQTDAGGRASLRFGDSSLALAGNSDATLMRIAAGVHVDLSSGTLRFSAAEGQVVEVHAEEAMIRLQDGKSTDATVTIVQPKVLQIDAHRGSLNFTYHQEFRVLPAGQIYRIYLDSPGSDETETSPGAQIGGAGSKVTYYIVGAGAAGAIAWATYNAIHSGNAPISPAKP